MIKKRIFWTMAAGVLGIGAVALAQSGMALYMNGKVVSNSVTIIGGRPYVLLADVARAQNMVVEKRAGGYELAVAGGANQVNGKLRGAIGDQLFDGKWGFTVLSVDTADHYDAQYATDPYTYKPNGANDQLVIIKCRVKNGRQASERPIMSFRHGHNTALTDDQGQSYQPIGFDKHGGDNDTGGLMLPGSQSLFVVLFSVPKNTVFKDLVYSLQTFPDDFPDGGTDVRVSLAK